MFLTRLLSTALAIFAIALALISLSMFFPDPAHAQPSDEAPGSVTWSVEPADETGPTGEAWIELSLNPGETATEHMLITNRGSRDVTFHLSAADGYFTKTGRFNMLPSDETSIDAGTWIALPATAEVGAGRSVTVPFDVAVPANATPGDHLAGVAASIRTEGDAVGVESRVGFRVMTRVQGELHPALSMTSQSAVYHPSANPFVPGTLAVTATISNVGNVRLGARPTVESSGPFGILSAQTPVPDLVELAPGESRSIDVIVRDVWPTFVTEVRTRALPVPVDGAAVAIDATALGETSAWSIPWAHLGILLLGILGLALLLWRDKTRKKSIQRMLEKAREEGRRQGATAGSRGLIILGILAVTGLCTYQAAPAWAAPSEGGISVQVDVTPAPVTPSPMASSSPQVDEKPGPLAQSGLQTNPGVVLTAAGLVSLGIGAVWVSLRARGSRRV